MDQPVSRYRGLVSNPESLFILRDVDYDDPDVMVMSALDDSRGHIAGTSGRLILVQTARAVMKVDVEVESWQRRPPQEDQAWEAQRELPLHSHTGVIYVEQVFLHPPRGLEEIPLAAGPGDYTVRVCMRGRDEVHRLMVELYQRGLGLPTAERIELNSRLNGVERYRIRIWPQDG